MSEVILCCDVSKYMNEYYWDSIDTYITEQKEKKEKKVEPEPEIDEETLQELMEEIKAGRSYH